MRLSKKLPITWCFGRKIKNCAQHLWSCAEQYQIALIFLWKARARVHLEKLCREYGSSMLSLDELPNIVLFLESIGPGISGSRFNFPLMLLTCEEAMVSAPFLIRQIHFVNGVILCAQDLVDPNKRPIHVSLSMATGSYILDRWTWRTARSY